MYRRHDRTLTVFGALLCSLVACLSGQALAEGPAAETTSRTQRVLILSGSGGHDWHGSAVFLREVLTATGRFDVRVCDVPAGLNARTLADFDVLVDLSGISAAAQ